MPTTTPTFKPWPAIYSAAKEQGTVPAADIRDVFASRKPKRVRKLCEELGVPVPAAYAKANVTAAKATKATPASAPDDAVKAARAAKAKEHAAKRNAAQTLRLESGYVDTLHTFGGQSIEVLSRTFDGKQRSMPVVRTAGTKALRRDTLVHMIAVALGTAKADDKHSAAFIAELVEEANAL